MIAALRRAELFALRVYRAWSATRLPHCRFTPTCSAYAVEAMHVHGFGAAHRLIARRILRCRPGGGFGYDPVPVAPLRSFEPLPQGTPAQ